MLGKRRRWFIITSLGLASVLGAVACANRTADPIATESTQAEDHRTPAVVVFDAALSETQLTAAQRIAVTAIADRFEADRSDKTELKRELRASAGDIVRVGTTDSEQFEAAIELAVQALEARIRLTANAVADVHALLDAEQRSAVAATLREHVAERLAAYARRTRNRERFKRVSVHLMLTGVQLDDLREVRKALVKNRKRLHPTREQIDALVDAFEREDFVAVSDAFHAERLSVMREHLAQFGSHADSALSLLRAEQRALLADLIELGPEAVGLTERKER